MCKNQWKNTVAYYESGRFLPWHRFMVAQMVKRLRAMQETQVQSLGWENPLEKEMATHSSILAWRIPQTEEPGGLQPIASQRVGHDWATSLSLSFCVEKTRKDAVSTRQGSEAHKIEFLIQEVGELKCPWGWRFKVLSVVVQVLTALWHLV